MQEQKQSLQSGRAAELARRHAALSADLKARGADALVATREGVVTYVTGYTTRTWSNMSRPVIVVLFSDEQVLVVCAETEADAVRAAMPEATVAPYVSLTRVDDHAGYPDGRVQFGPAAGSALYQVLREHDVHTLAIDGLQATFPPVANVVAMMPHNSMVTFDASSMVWARRLRKSDWELQRIGAAANVLGRAFEEFEQRLKPGLTEREIHSLLAAKSFEAGADLLGYTDVVAGTERGLFGAPTDRAWMAGDVLYVDGGVVVEGYWADFCRMYTVGAPTMAQSEGYVVARRGLKYAQSNFHAGMTAGELCWLIQQSTGIEPGDVGFGRFGHGIGLYMPEPPSIHIDDNTELGEGVVLCIEPAVLYSGANYVVEEEYVVAAGHLQLLSPAAPEELISI